MHKTLTSNVYVKVFSTPAGKQVLEDLEHICTFTPNTQDSNDVFLKLGKGELLKYIKAQIEKGKTNG